MAQLPSGPILRSEARRIVAGFLGLAPEQVAPMAGDAQERVDPEIEIWALQRHVASQPTPPGQRRSRGRPRDPGASANAMLLHAFPQLAESRRDGAAHFALLEAVWNLDAASGGVRFPGPRIWAIPAPRSGAKPRAQRQRDAVMAAARDRVRRALAR